MTTPPPPRKRYVPAVGPPGSLAVMTSPEATAIRKPRAQSEEKP